MKVILKEGYDSVSNQLEFYLVGLENFDNFDVVIDLLKHEKQIEIIETVEGMYSRSLKFDIANDHFELIYHEDVGVYAFSLTQSDLLNNLLRDILQNIVSNIQQNFNVER
jgi:hypothetical protein